MLAEQSLARGASYLDEATENLTFDEFEWAFEEVWRGVAWVLNAQDDPPAASLELGPPGVPAIDTLPGTTRLVSQLKALHTKLGRASDREIALAVNAELIERLVFEAWDLHDAVGQRLGLVDDRLGNKLILTDVSPGRVGSQVIHRRTALKLLAAGSVIGLQACTKIETKASPQAAATTPVTEPTATTQAQVKAVTPLGGSPWQTTDPFLFCAYHLDDYPAGNPEMGPAASLDGRELGRDFQGRDNWRMYHGRTIPGFPRHPHRGFETVTVVRSGMLDHSDSMGATARYSAGDVQWLTAGGGIQHAEMFPLLSADAPNPLELYQIWLNLPRSDKMVDPHFTMLWNEKIPRVVARDSDGRLVEVTVTAGAYGADKPPSPPPNSWASRPDAEVAIWTLRMEPGSRFELPAVSPGTKRSLYVHRGAGMRVGEVDVPPDHRVEVDDPGTLALTAGPEETEVLLLQGRPIDEPVAKRGPFVMNTQDEIRQAYADYQATQFGGWPWRSNDPVHVREKGRFARHIDGRFEEPT